MHDSRSGGFSKFYRKKERHWDSVKRGKPVVHESATLRKLNTKNEASPDYAPWILSLDYLIEEE